MKLPSTATFDRSPFLYVALPDEIGLIPDALTLLEILISRSPIGQKTTEEQARNPHRLQMVVQRRFVKKISGSGSKQIAEIYRRTTIGVYLDPLAHGDAYVRDVVSGMQQLFRIATPTSVSICNFGMNIMACAPSRQVVESYVHDHHISFTTLRIRSLRLPGANDQQLPSLLRSLLAKQVLLPFGGTHASNSQLPVLLSTSGNFMLLEQRNRPHFVLQREVRLQLSRDPSTMYIESIAAALACDPSIAELTGISFDDVPATLSSSDVFLSEDTAPSFYPIQCPPPLTTDELLQRQLGIPPPPPAGADVAAEPSTETEVAALLVIVGQLRQQLLLATSLNEPKPANVHVPDVTTSANENDAK
jgi:hypothetical protein